MIQIDFKVTQGNSIISHGKKDADYFVVLATTYNPQGGQDTDIFITFPPNEFSQSDLLTTMLNVFQSMVEKVALEPDAKAHVLQKIHEINSFKEKVH